MMRRQVQNVYMNSGCIRMCRWTCPLRNLISAHKWSLHIPRGSLNVSHAVALVLHEPRIHVWQFGRMWILCTHTFMTWPCNFLCPPYHLCLPPSSGEGSVIRGSLLTTVILPPARVERGSGFAFCPPPPLLWVKPGKPGEFRYLSIEFSNVMYF